MKIRIRYVYSVLSKLPDWYDSYYKRFYPKQMRRGGV